MFHLVSLFPVVCGWVPNSSASSEKLSTPTETARSEYGRLSHAEFAVNRKRESSNLEFPFDLGASVPVGQLGTLNLWKMTRFPSEPRAGEFRLIGGRGTSVRG